jgi:hypothetical protein
LYFLHIPKTAGTSLRFWLHDLFAKNDLLPCHILEEVDRLDRETVNNHRFFSGHFGWQILDYLDRPVPTLTWLRDPLKRVISNYNYSRDNHDELVRIAIENGRMDWVDSYNQRRSVSLGDLVSDPKYVGYSDNLQTRYLSGVFPSEGSVLIDQTILDRAKANLKKMFFFGICEWMDASTDALCHQLNVPPRRMNLQFNRAANRQKQSRSVFTDAEILKIEKSESYDRELYEFACDLFQSRFSKFWNTVTSSQQQVGMDQILEQYQSENTQSRIENVLIRRFQQQNSNLEKPLDGTLSFSDPIYQSGWYARSGSKMGETIRWAGPSNTSVIFFPFDSNHDYEVEFFIRSLADYRLVKTLSVVVNDHAIPVRFEKVDSNKSLPQQYRVTFKVPVEIIPKDQSFTQVEFKVTGDLVDMGTGDGSKVSFATDAFHYRAMDA